MYHTHGGSQYGGSQFGGSQYGGSTGDSVFGNEESQRLARIFELNREKMGMYVPRDRALQLIRERVGDAPQTLSDIMLRSDLDRDGRLSLPEFVCAMHLAELARSGRHLPSEVTPQQQRDLARSVERLVSHGSHHQPTVKPVQPDDFGTNSVVGDMSYQVSGTPGLGHIARLFAEAADQDPNGKLRQVSGSVMQERRDLERELSRQTDAKTTYQDVHNTTNNLHDQHCRMETEISSAKRRISHLKEELTFLQGEVQLAEGDLDALRVASTSMGTTSQKDSRDVFNRVRGEQDLLRKDKATVDEMLQKIEGLAAEKLKSRNAQQVQLEQQRQIEHDRNLILTAIEGDYKKLHKVRAERLQHWEERNQLEKELSELTQAEGLQLTPRRLGGDDRGIRAK